MTILIIDDSASMRRMLREYLSRCSPGVVCVECSAGEDALAAYERARPDWTFMDIKMGVLDGIAATKLIRNAFPDAKIAMLTQYDDDDLRSDAIRAGAAGYFLKDNLREIESILSQA